MKKQRAALFVGCLVASAAACGVVACSSNGDTTNTTPQLADASKGHDDGGTTTDGGGTTTDGGDDTDGGCGKAPSLHAGDGGSVYCPFGPGGKALDCATATTYCCIGGEISKDNYAVSACQTIGQACDNPPPDGGKYSARPVECEEAADCSGRDAAASVCCATGAVPAMDPTCNYYKEHPGFTAISCVAASACPTGKVQICSTSAECSGGKTCTPFKAVGLQLGFCM